MLLRPIIILSEDVVRNKHGEAIGYNDLFGIYLPTLSKPKECVPIPIVLAYDQSHFCPLQTNDLNTGGTIDNYLPLYQSIDHIRNQNLLPIRFLGAENTVEKSIQQLQSYLRIKRLAYYPDTNGPSISILCAELGNKSIQSKDNFFLLYHDYVLDCIETQTKRITDEQNAQKRDQEYYAQTQPLSDTNQRVLMQRDNSSPPPSYASVTARLNDNKNLINLERRPSYDKAVANGTTYAPLNEGTRRIEIQQVQNPPNHTYTNGTTSNSNSNHHYPHPMNGKPSTSKSNWDSNDDLTPNGKTITNSNPRGSDSKLKQGKSYIFSVNHVSQISKSIKKCLMVLLIIMCVRVYANLL